MYNLYISYKRLGFNTDTKLPHFYPEDIFCGSVSDDELDFWIENLEGIAEEVNGYVWFTKFE